MALRHRLLAGGLLSGCLMCAAAARAQPSPPPAATPPAATTGSAVGAEKGSTATAPAAGSQVEEVVVTARRTAEKLQSTPIAVTAVTAQQLRERSATNIADLSGVVPSLHASANAFGGNNSKSFFIRGVGQIDVLPTTDPGVGVYVDGIYLARTTGDLFDLADVQQVEVLRGPQGTLFGKNTSGGAISVTTRRPTGDFGGSAEITLGDFDRNDYRATVDFPILKDTLAGSLSLVSRNEDGYGKSYATGERLGNTDLKAVRGALNYTGPNNSSYYLTADYSNTDERTDPLSIIAIYPNATRNLYYGLVVAKRFPGSTFTPALITKDPLDTFDDPNSKNDLYVGGVSGVGSIDVGSVTLKSLTGFRTQEAVVWTDTSATPVQVFDNQRTVVETQVTQEFQATGKAFDGHLKYVAGVFYEHEQAKIDTNQIYLPFLYSSLVAIGRQGTDQDILADTHQTDDSYAGYFNLNYAITDKLSATAGLRYSAETKSVSQSADYVQRLVSIYTASAGGANLPRGSVIDAEKTFYGLTPTFGLQYQATRDAFLYASYSKGFKSGGFDGRPIAGIFTPAAFDPEKVTSYEVGSKLDLLNRRARVNLAAFWSDYDGLQVQDIVSFSSNGGLPIFFNEIQNAGSARIRGVELETTYIPVTGLELTANTSWLDAQFTHLDPGVAFNIHDHLQQTPKWTASFSAQYTQALGAGSVVYRADYDFTSTVYNELPGTFGYNAAGTGIVNNGPLRFPTRQPGYALLNSRITFNAPDGRTSLALFATNLTDERYITFGFGLGASFGESLGYYGRPREYGLQLTRRF